MAILLDEIENLGKSLCVDLLSVETQIIAYLYFHGATPSQALQVRTSSSPAGFHNVKDRLKKKGLIVRTKSDEDRRVNYYNLADSARSVIDKWFAQSITNGSESRLPIDSRTLTAEAQFAVREASA